MQNIKNKIKTEGIENNILPERYKAYELSAGGLWRFELQVPVSVTLEPEEIIAHCRKYAFLSECNDNLARMYGFERAEEFIGAAIDDFVDFNDPVGIDYFKKFIRNGFESANGETKEFDRLGKTKYFLNNMIGIVENGLLKRIWGTQQDITEQRQSEEKIRYLATLVESVSDIIISYNNDFNIVSWNKAAEEIYGCAAEEMIGEKMEKLLSQEVQDISRKDFFNCLYKTGGWKGEKHILNKSGKPVTVLTTITQIKNEAGEMIGFVSIAKDITEKRKAEEQLQKSELFYRNLISHSLDGIIMTNADGQIIYCAPSVVKLTGHEPEQLLGHHFLKFVHPDDLVIAREAFILELTHQTELNYVHLRLKHSSGLWTWCIVRGHNLLDNPGFNAMVIYFADNTKRKETEDRLKESEQRFRNLIHDLKLGVIVQNEKTEVLICNKAALDILGISEEQMLGKNFHDFKWTMIHEDGIEFLEKDRPLLIAIQTKKSVHDVVMGVIRPFTSDKVWILVNAEPVLDADNNIVNVISCFTDITEQKRQSQELIAQEIQKQKLLTQATIDGQEQERLQIGKELHDNINQHLSTTRLYIEVAKEKASGEILEMITHAHKNLTDIINEIRRLSQSLVPPTLGDLGLIESVKDLCSALIITHSYHIEFHHRYFTEEGLPDNMKLMFFRIVQEQVNNIIRHAHATQIIIRLQADAEHIILSIIDNGMGFDLTQNKKGLGLTNMRNRAGLFNGKVSIDTFPGKGCTVSITVPFAKNNNNLSE